jgi:hypothetical protein
MNAIALLKSLRFLRVKVHLLSLIPPPPAVPAPVRAGRRG